MRNQILASLLFVAACGNNTPNLAADANNNNIAAVVNDADGPKAGVEVVFVNPDGKVAADLKTDENGRAEAVIEEIVRRMFDDGHAVALHSHTRAYMLMSADAFARTLRAAADHIEDLSGRRPCAAFRPHAGWRTWHMYEGLKQLDYRLIGWSWMLWDWNWFRARTADSVVARIAPRASNGDIIVLHDGDESAPFEDQRHTVDAVARLIPYFRAKGFAFGTICDNDLKING